MQKTWRQLAIEALRSNGESWADIIKINGRSDTLNEMAKLMDHTKEFTIWTHTYMYWPLVNDGVPAVESDFRNPKDHNTLHFDFD